MKTFGYICLALVISALVFMLFGWVALMLWDAIAVAVFNLPELSFWQMYGLIWLVHIIFPWSTTTINKN
jgi:hypothetical protein